MIKGWQECVLCGLIRREQWGLMWIIYTERDWVFNVAWCRGWVWYWRDRGLKKSWGLLSMIDVLQRCFSYVVIVSAIFCNCWSMLLQVVCYGYTVVVNVRVHEYFCNKWCASVLMQVFSKRCSCKWCVSAVAATSVVWVCLPGYECRGCFTRQLFKETFSVEITRLCETPFNGL